MMFYEKGISVHVSRKTEKKKIVLWGTGQVAEEFFEQWGYYRSAWEKLSRYPFPIIEYVWDSDVSKQGTIFHEWEIGEPFAQKPDQDTCFIIAIARYSFIHKKLEVEGYRRNIDFWQWQTFIAKLRYAMVESAEEILLDMALNKALDIPLDNIRNSMCSVENAQSIYKIIEKSSFSALEKTVAQDILLGRILKQWMGSGWNRKEFTEICKYFSPSNVVSGLSMVLNKNVDKLCSFLLKNEFLNKDKKTIKTIGIYDLRYSNGGGQRVLSLLLPVYVSLGYRVILITDNIDDNEYPIPEDVVRVVLKQKWLSSMRLRLEEFSHYIRKYHIDIMCYHYTKHDISLFYEALYFKLLGIPVLIEIHIMFLMLIRKRCYVAEMWKNTFRLMDRIIVLSRCNELFWKNLGCNATYIPNPVENGIDLWKCPVSFSKRNGKTILWIGRTTDRGKHLTDVVDIIEAVKEIVPDVKLKIVGGTEGLSYMRQLISKKHLEGNIEFLGYHTDVTSFYEEADMMLMTSEMEGFPMVLVESKIYGVPTVMYDLPYLELVKDTRGIISVPQRDKLAAAEALIAILNDETLRHRMSVDAKRSIYPFIAYDIAGAWKKVFDEVSNSSYSKTPCEANPEQGMVQELLMQEIWKEEE